jgi:hypothetical protein
LFDRKIENATTGLKPDCKKLLQRVSKKNALVIADYIIKAPPPGQQQDARDVSERYIAKSNPWILMVSISTPNAPDGLFERIEKGSEETCLYKRLFLDYI